METTRDRLVPGTPMWTITLDREANDAACLFSHGLAATSRIRHDYHDAVAAMSLLALGAEKMLKLTIGIQRVCLTGVWPSKNYMRRIGHRVERADRRARLLLDGNRGEAHGYVQELMAKVDADLTIAEVLKVLDRFGNEGRFYFLDALGEEPQTQTAPHFLWGGLMSSLIKVNPGLGSRMADPQDWKQARPLLNQMVVTSLASWWEFYRAVWTTGVIGDDAKQYSQTLKLTHG